MDTVSILTSLMLVAKSITMLMFMSSICPSVLKLLKLWFIYLCFIPLIGTEKLTGIKIAFLKINHFFPSCKWSIQKCTLTWNCWKHHKYPSLSRGRIWTSNPSCTMTVSNCLCKSWSQAADSCLLLPCREVRALICHICVGRDALAEVELMDQGAGRVSLLRLIHVFVCVWCV